MPMSTRELEEIAIQLNAADDKWARMADPTYSKARSNNLPSLVAIQKALTLLSIAFFPRQLGSREVPERNRNSYISRTLEEALDILKQEVEYDLDCAQIGSGVSPGCAADHSSVIVRNFSDNILLIINRLNGDLMAAYNGDPGAKSVDEVLLCYPGFKAVIYHRIANCFYREGAFTVARIISELAHSETGIDIHPGARIGDSFFIDHGTGVVIGETAILGDRVRLYQMVTLGAKRFLKDKDGHIEKGGQRHPIIEDDVVIYAAATILGRITVGEGSVIGGNVWLTRSIPPYSSITQANAQGFQQNLVVES